MSDSFDPQVVPMGADEEGLPQSGGDTEKFRYLVFYSCQDVEMVFESVEVVRESIRGVDDVDDLEYKISDIVDLYPVNITGIVLLGPEDDNEKLIDIPGLCQSLTNRQIVEAEERDWIRMKQRRAKVDRLKIQRDGYLSELKVVTFCLFVSLSALIFLIIFWSLFS